MQAFRYEDELNSEFLPPLSLWLAVEPLLPQPVRTSKVGRKAKPDQQMFAAIYYRIRTGCHGAARAVEGFAQMFGGRLHRA